LIEAELDGSYEASHAQLAIQCFDLIEARKQLRQQGKLETLEEPSQAAADQSYVDTANRVFEGLKETVKSYADSKDPRERKVFELFP
jgi:hypothetical protein